jgi:hypothetical protein
LAIVAGVVGAGGLAGAVGLDDVDHRASVPLTDERRALPPRDWAG